jgi:glycosyltransferase involved in cell wall biosynthesis
MISPEKILFISHDASRTGAPILLLNFLRWFKASTDNSFEILLGRGGELEKDFAALAPTDVFYNEGEGSEIVQKHQFIRRITRRLGINNPGARIRRKLAGSNIGLIYSNTSTNGNILQALSFLDCPVISHIHELEYSLKERSDKLDYVLKRSVHFIACAQAVKDHLVSRYSVPAEKVSVIYEFLASPLIDKLNAATSRKLLRRELSVDEDAFIVGSAGTRHWRKGPDLFIQLADRVRSKMDGPIHFAWLGGGDQTQQHAIDHDIKKAGLGTSVHFLDAKPNPLDYFADFDLFALTSREDPFPLVCLEAASLVKPVLCFDKAGGEPEFVEKDCGFVVPSVDVDAMADRVIELYNNRELLRQLGQNAAKKVRARHKLEDNAPKIFAVIKKYLKSNCHSPA